jgi:crotonobetainyl-CoA:carnitine CoA-transferase CaiB-like acyl-CoA transferase
VTETSLLESLLDLQFELLTTRLNDPTVAVRRKGVRSAHAFLPAPYGMYPTSDGYLAIAMNPVPKVGRLLDLPELAAMTDPADWWERQEEAETLLAERLRTRTRDEWLAVLDAEDVWCAPVLTLEELVAHDGFRAIAMTQEVVRDGLRLTTTRSPIRIDGRRLTNPRPGPLLGEHDDSVRRPRLTGETA